MEVAPVRSSTRWTLPAASSRSLSAKAAAMIWATASSISRISRALSVATPACRVASRASRQASTAVTTGCPPPGPPAPASSAARSGARSRSDSPGVCAASSSSPRGSAAPDGSVSPAAPAERFDGRRRGEAVEDPPASGAPYVRRSAPRRAPPTPRGRPGWPPRPGCAAPSYSHHEPRPDQTPIRTNFREPWASAGPPDLWTKSGSTRPLRPPAEPAPDAMGKGRRSPAGADAPRAAGPSAFRTEITPVALVRHVA